MKKHLLWAMIIIIFLFVFCQTKETKSGLGVGSIIRKKVEEVKAKKESIPSAPSNLQATAVSSSQINLTWQDNSDNEQGFKIERKTGAGGTYSEITTVNANVTSYNNTGLSASTTYYYRVRAYNAAGNSNYSNEVPATTLVGGNNNPSVPSQPSGPTSGYTNTSYSYSTSATDPDGDQIKYGWDWDGNGTVDEWTGLYNSGAVCSTSHSWASANIYNVKVKAQDEHGLESGWSTALAVTISVSPGSAPNQPSQPSGTSSGSHNNAYSYSTSATDPDGDQIKYGWDWDGNGTVDEWSSLGASGWTDNRSHTWLTPGTWNVKVKAQDEHGLESGWSTALPVTMINDPPSTPSKPSGPSTGYSGTSYSYSTSATDPNNDISQYGWDWNGDGTVDEWTSSSTRSHTWSTAGTYNVQVKAQDEHGAQSGWSTAKQVTISTKLNLYPTQDECVVDGGNTNTGYINDDYLCAGTLGNYPLRALLKFDISGLPAGITISSATLYLYNYGNSGGSSKSMGAQRITQSWSEGTPDGTPCPTYSSIFVSQTVSNAVGWYTWNITSMVQSWYNGTYTNYGVIINPLDSVNNFFYFWSREHPSNVPYLEVIYTK